MNEMVDMNNTDGQQEEIDDASSDSGSGDSFIDDSEDGEPSVSGHDDGSSPEAPLTDAEVEELIAELLEVESKAAEAQESLEKESLAQVEHEVRAELAVDLNQDELEAAVANEMRTYKEEWETVLDELETESAQLLEQLDGCGIDLPSLYKSIEKQAPDCCSTEAWKKRTHWAGSQVTSEVSESIAHAEKYLHTKRPVIRKNGKMYEEGASGFLEKKLTDENGVDNESEDTKKIWESFENFVATDNLSEADTSFGSKPWASVYLASTPQEAASLGLKLPGVDEVEEISDVNANEVAKEEIALSEEQKKNFRKVKEEDDANVELKLQLHLKRRRQRFRCKQEATKQEDDTSDLITEDKCNDSIPSIDCSQGLDGEGVLDTVNGETSHSLKVDVLGKGETVGKFNEEKLFANGAPLGILNSEQRGEKRSHESEDADDDSKRSRTVIIDSDDEEHARDDKYVSSLQVKEEIDVVNVVNLPFLSSNGTFHCTACAKVVVACEVREHPLLKVIVCESCRCIVEERMLEKDPDCCECYCGWCGRSNELISCKSCKLLFCTTCIKGNLGESFSLKIQASVWQCCCCAPSLLQQLTVECEKALLVEGFSGTSSDSDSGQSENDTTKGLKRAKRRPKKRIRRILDDAELGEETKRKIAIEKARQEHLKSLQAKSWIKKTESCLGTAVEGTTVDVLGDAIKGYIVNVVREKDEEAVRIPLSISSNLKPHQVSGIRFMWENIIQSIKKVKSGDKGLGCILAHTMGLGKTFQVIAFLYTAMRQVDLGLKTALIVTPVNVLHNWKYEFTKWKPEELKALRVYMLEEVPRERRIDLLTKWRNKGGIFLIGYAAFRNLSLGKNIKDRNLAREYCNALQNGPDILVCDEAHMIKNRNADITVALKQVKCQRRIALTGSPLQNNLMEYYCMVDFVREGFLGNSQEFRNRFQNPIENGQHTNSTADDVKVMNQRSHILYEQLKGYVQRMDMNVVKKDLPPKTVYVIAVKLSQLQRILYKKFLDEHGFTNDKISGEKSRSFFAGYQALAQVWNHPGLLRMSEQKNSARREVNVENFVVDGSSSDDNIEDDVSTGEKQKIKNDLKKSGSGYINEGWWTNLLTEKNFKEVDYSGKMVLLLDLLSMSSEEGDKALVFSQSLTTLDLIEFYLSKLPRKERKGKFWKQGKDWYRLDGSTPASERQKLVEKFNESTNSRVKCTLISTRAGSLGINLHSANRVIIVDGSWNPTYDLQAIFRAWRYGQRKAVYAYRLMAHGTMEEKIYKRQVTKEGLAARVVDKQQVHRTMSREEMLHLFDFGDEESSDAVLGESQIPRNLFLTSQPAGSLKQKISNGCSSSDKLMESLVSRHYPRWIANYHEHETLLQENEEEKLSKEEQDLAWETYRRTIEGEEVQRIPIDDSTVERKPPVAPPLVALAAQVNQINSGLSRVSSRNHVNTRRCTILSHKLTLRSQGTKDDCATVCGECGQEISWGDLNRDPK
ncbi:protein CHROMATIN REMODELING 20-like [Papaver somniferum]|uniref:protein CHROMATIN REMODELING 20-like n=1 Tax=Papaver somniferum TaxID=3469 RepID=UPI000E702242|nr:protein CHROMATIN REMODELING 20-like [Papaver somniferum]XP_026421718.1 protein CHROMATIN REMODELING 20-like [Papaver somniferum]